jgi:hypothetical protein
VWAPFAFFALLFTFLSLGDAKADFTGVDLYKICSGMMRSPGERDVCTAYIRGFSEGYYLGILLGVEVEHAHRIICYPHPPKDNPPDVTQAELVVRKYMADHPEELDRPAPIVVQDALSTAFGCQHRER